MSELTEPELRGLRCKWLYFVSSGDEFGANPNSAKMTLINSILNMFILKRRKWFQSHPENKLDFNSAVISCDDKSVNI